MNGWRRRTADFLALRRNTSLWLLALVSVLSMKQRALVVSGIDRSSPVVVHWLKRRWGSVGRLRLVRVARSGGVATQPMGNPKFGDGME